MMLHRFIKIVLSFLDILHVISKLRAFIVFIIIIKYNNIFLKKLILNIERKKKETLNPSKRYVEK